ncbi:RDD family protein [Nocardia sp. alder85J]|uniref:RDD family protein n=1 Tax=Nocardia sp. alder85J TaxID=2862949 RepID=UPI001CD48886|nr:RDD family protein [Nocardia sp. alder85J]MCX4096565.1 RDD family protein [Nocardia sp. alder85J]
MAVFTTGEAVALDLPIARIPTRAVAFVLDVLLQVMLGWGLTVGVMALLALFGADLAWWDTAFTVTFVAVLAGYPIVWETLLRGRTPGKAALGLRVVRGDGGPIDFRHALTRGLAAVIIDFWAFGVFGAIGVLTSLCSARARRVGDVLAGTVVVYDRTRIPWPKLAIMPPWMQEWARQLDLSGLTEDLALPTRHYLTRYFELTPETQQRLGQALVTAVCARIRAVPPPGSPPLHILGAVISERQRRTLGVPAQPNLMPLEHVSW